MSYTEDIRFYGIENEYGVRQITKTKAELLNAEGKVIETFYAVDGVEGFKDTEDLLNQAQTLALAYDDENAVPMSDDEYAESFDFILSENMIGYED